MNAPFRIGLFTFSGLRSFSNIPYFIFQTLQKTEGVEAVLLSHERPYRRSLAKRVVKLLERLATGRRYMWEKNIGLCRHISAELDAAVARDPVDAILMFGAEGGAFANATIPLFCYTDSIFGARIGLYEDQPWTGLSRSSIREGVRMQQLALDRLDKLFVSSSWAIEQAGSRFGYKGIHEKCEVVSIGANLPSAPSTEDGRSAGPTEIVPFVWLGSYWRRKGGEFAVEVIGRLRESGTNAILHVVGPVQPSRSDSWIRPHGRLSYDIPEEFERLKAIYRESRALLLPTRGDTTPLVISEAFAFGRPAITTRMGGIPEMVVCRKMLASIKSHPHPGKDRESREASSH